MTASRVVFATDLHLADGHGGFEAFAADLEEIADLAPDLLVLGGEIGDDDLAWLDTALGVLDRTRPLLLFVHIPLASTYPERRGVSQEITDVWRVTNASAVFERLADWPAPVVVGQGHLHENEHVHVGDIHLVSVGAVCGRWWQQGSATRCDDEWIALPPPVPVPVDDPFISTHHWALPSIVKGDTLRVRTRMRAQLWEVNVEAPTAT